MNLTFIIIISTLVFIFLLFLYFLKRSWKRRKFFDSFVYLLMSLVMLLSVLLVLTVTAGTIGYKALVFEELAATVHITSLGGDKFKSKIVRHGCRDTVFELAGNELYMDARILKWKPIFNVLGLHTAYCLDRVSGRYTDIREERAKARTMYSLSGEIMPWDLFFLRTRWPFLAPLLDAQYGSAAFVPVRNVRVVRIMVTTSGLIARIE